MKIFRFADLVPVPWKNGGGVTREISRRELDGVFVWRLSIADVALEGPFSAFPGLQRILTVIEGKGMVLQQPEQAALAANLYEPVAFSGDASIEGRLPNGPCRDFNVIWNPALTKASATLIHGPREVLNPSTNENMSILCLTGAIDLSTGRTLAPLDSVLLETEADSAVLTDGSKGLLILIAPISKP